MRVATPIRAKITNGPVRPTPGNTIKGASAGPITVPRPKLDAINDSACVRSARGVRLAT